MVATRPAPRRGLGHAVTSGPGAAAALERTGRAVVAGTWGCAAIVMVGSAASAAVAYDFLGEHWGLGLATGIAVDVALCVALVGDRRLYAHGLSSNWGRGLRVTTASMSLVLNSGVAFATGQFFLAFLHAFLPILLVVLTEYGQDVLLQFTRLARAQERTNEPGPTLVAPARQQPVTTTPAPTTPSWVPAPAVRSTTPPIAPAVPAGDSRHNLTDRVRQIIEDNSGKAPGRRALAKQLGVSEHQARNLLDTVTGPGLNGSEPKENTHG